MIRASLTMGSFARSSKDLGINTQGLETKNLLARALGLWKADVKVMNVLVQKKNTAFDPREFKI